MKFMVLNVVHQFFAFKMITLKITSQNTKIQTSLQGLGSTRPYPPVEIEPDEVYNLGAQSHAAVSFDPEYTVDVDGVGTLRHTQEIRILGLKKQILSSVYL